MFLTEEKLHSLIETCQQSGNFSSLRQTLWDVFSSPDSLGASWPLSSSQTIPASTLSAAACDMGGHRKTKEELRALEGEKDVDSCEENRPIEKVLENAKQKAEDIQKGASTD